LVWIDREEEKFNSLASPLHLYDPSYMSVAIDFLIAAFFYLVGMEVLVALSAPSLLRPSYS
jgi:hypothetical protein